MQKYHLFIFAEVVLNKSIKVISYQKVDFNN